MPKTKKVQVTLDEQLYELLAEIAEHQGRSLAAVVRESIERYCVAPEVERRKQRALDELLSLEPAPALGDYAQWERDYSALKTEADRGGDVE